MTLTIRDPVYTLTVEPTSRKNPADELESHPAFYSKITRKYAEKLLLGTQPMTYVLWTMQIVNDGAIKEQCCLSYMKTNMTVEHLTFGYISDRIMNSHYAAALSDLIPQMMECQSNECKMLLNPCHYRK
jgi:hypothetical protein